jgi:hypothetical protein
LGISKSSAGGSGIPAVYSPRCLGVRLASLVLLCIAARSGTTQEVDDSTKQIDIRSQRAVIQVDGVLDEEFWQNATRIEDLHEVEPNEFTAPSQQTEVYLFYDSDALYVGARLWDTEADRITANVLRQGEGLGSEDRFAIIIDPYLDRRSGYRFQVNPNGVRWDAIYQNVSSLESNWEGIWEGAATRDESGWTAEMAIPFKTVSFNPNTAEWGMNFLRTIQRSGEEIAWVSRNRQMNPGVTGIASGFAGLEQGRGLDIVPSGAVRRVKTYGDAGDAASDFEPSLDVFYKVTPSLNAALTINTDFSATEVDDRQVNLSRFSLFFPEKRDFFLQDADIFEFGRIGGGGFNRGGGGNPSVPGSAAQNGRPFFSRRIGLSASGLPVDIDYGGKLSGRVGRWNIGALAIRQGAFEDVGETDIFVGRVAANVLNESAVGIIVTDGNPRSNAENSLIGADFRYRNSRLPGNRLLESQLWYQETDEPGVSDQNRAFGYGISLPTATGWRGGFTSRQVEQNFNPGVGFVDQLGIRDYALDFGHRWRFQDSWLRETFLGFDGYRQEWLDTGDVRSEAVGLRFTFNNNTEDGVFSRVVRNREVLLEDFVIYTSSDYDPAVPERGRQVVVPAGDYSFWDWRVGTRTGEQRKVSYEGSISGGDFYDGHRIQLNANVTWIPTLHLRFGLSYQANDIKLPGGDFVVRLSSMRTEVVFSSRLSWVNLLQYDNVSETLGINSRLHWIPEAGREGFIVLNRALNDADKDGSFRPLSADLAVKFGYTFRF